MSRFKFGEILATVERLGPEPTAPGFEQYTVRLDHPDEKSWIESRVIVPRGARTAGSDYRLAFNLMAGLREATLDPKRWQSQMAREGNVSREELAATLEMAYRLEPYLDDAISDAMHRAWLYLEHWEKKKSEKLGISRPLHLPEKIRAKEDIANFFAYLYLVERVDFHPDEDFNTYVDRNGAPTYSMEEGHERNRLMAEGWEIAEAEGLDIYEIVLWVQGLIYDQKELAQGAPKWLTSLSHKWI